LSEGGLWPLSYSSSDLWKLPGKIRLQELVLSNSENISCVSLLKHKNSRKQGTGKWYKNKHGASKIIDTLETYQPPEHCPP
jgi:hypothetical protein